jgi:hypothetical protein
MVEEMLLRQRLEWREFGTRNIANTTAYTGVWCEIVVITAATFTTLTMEGSTGTWTGVAFPVGHVIRGRITAITLTSGSIQAVNAEPQRATLTTALSGANNDMVFSARIAGSKGNGISIAYVNPGTPSAALSVAVVARAITVNLATNGGSSITSTAAEVKAALEANERIADLITIANSGADTGAGVVTALTATNLAGGAG